MAKGGERHGLEAATEESAVTPEGEVVERIGIVLERGEAAGPEVVGVEGLESAHEGPIDVSVAVGEAVEVLQTTPHQFCAAQVGGATQQH